MAQTKKTGAKGAKATGKSAAAGKKPARAAKTKAASGQAKEAEAQSVVKHISKKAARKARHAAPSRIGRGEATLCMVRISAQKARLAVDMIRGQQVESALNILQFSPKKSCKIVLRVLKSAIANAHEHGGADVDKLWVVAGWVNMGQSIKRFMPRARGSASPIIKRSAHVTLQVAENR